MMDLEFWTDFADGAIMFPLGIIVPLLLAALGQRRAATGWTVAVGCVWAAMLVLKLTGYALAAVCPDSAFSALDLVTPSGHVASSASIYGGLVGLLLAGPGTLLKRSLAAALTVAVVIGLTRVLLGVHSLAEVIVGAMVGIPGAAWAARNAVDRRVRLPVLATLVLVIVTFHGDHTSWEEPIQDAALRLIQVWTPHS